MKRSMEPNSARCTMTTGATLAAAGHVGDVETARQIEIELDGRELPRPSDSVDHLDVDLRAVEDRLAVHALVREPASFDRLFECRLRHVPLFVGPRVLRRIGRVAHAQLDRKLVEAEARQQRRCAKSRVSVDLARQLLGCAEDVRVVLCEAAYAQQPVQRARELVPVHGPHLGDANRQLAVAVQLAFVDENVARAVHRLDDVLLPLDVHDEHVVAVVGEMPRCLPQVRFRDVRREDELVAALAVLVASGTAPSPRARWHPSGCQNTSPPPASSLTSNRSSALPSRRWSRFSASAKRVR